jgi:predicted regulator of Ras-like GTPase activity (Roadblock/LC7/MglB family)
MVRQKKNLEETESEIEPIAIESSTSEDDLRTILGQIKNHEGVIGYILRNTTSAAIDLDDPNKLMGYAVLSSSAFDVSERLSELFDLGKVKDIIVEGKDTKTVNLKIGENNVSIFMEKSTDIKKVLERTRSL